MKKTALYIPSLIIIITLTACGFGCGGVPADAADKPGATATQDSKPPSVQLVGIKDIEAMRKSAEGKVTVINLWATWCPPCVMELAHLAEFYREMDREKTAFFAISLNDPAEAESKVPQFQKKAKIPFDIGVLKERDVDALGKVLGQSLSGAIPTTLVYDPSGKLVKFWEGAITKADLEAVVKPLL